MHNLQKKLNDLKSKLYEISPELRPKTRLCVHPNPEIEINLYGENAEDIVRELQEGFSDAVANLEVTQGSYHIIRITSIQEHIEHRQQKSLENALNYLYKRADAYQYKRKR